MSMRDNGIVLQDKGVPVAAALCSSNNNNYTIYSTRPNHQGQDSVNLVHNGKLLIKLYAHATVERVEKTTPLQVLCSNDDEPPSHTIHNVAIVANHHYYTNHEIRKHGKSDSHMLETSAAGVDDVIMMVLLATIADQADDRV